MAVPHPNAVVLNAMPELQPWHEVVSQTDRQDYLDWLYQRDGRKRKSHPMHGLYTGLAEKYKDIFAV
jgi:hypothetical protein